MNLRLLHAFFAASLVLSSIAFGQSSVHSLTIVALGDAGERGAVLRGNAGLLENMRTGQHNGGKCDVLLFLGNDFGETGLNVPAGDVDGEFTATLGPFRGVVNEIGRTNVHGIPGEREYYARKAAEKTALFGLITMSEWPVGVSDKGVQRAAQRSEWSYHAHFPGSAVYPVAEGAQDSVELLFFDSALLLRTKPAAWTAPLDSLRRLLRGSAAHPGVAWRILMTHHPLASAGEHAGYAVWNDEDSTVEHVSGCDRDSNAYAFVRNWLDPEDLCTDRYTAYRDSLASIVRASGVTIQAVVSSHDQSLQFLASSDPGSWSKGVPPIQIVSGCGSEVARVRLPQPPILFTAAERKNSGRSTPGFVQITWPDGMMHVRFFNERNGDPVEMGGRTEFVVTREARLQ